MCFAVYDVRYIYMRLSAINVNINFKLERNDIFSWTHCPILNPVSNNSCFYSYQYLIEAEWRIYALVT